FLIALNAGFAAGDSAERADLKFAMIALFIELDENVIRGIAPIRDVKKEGGPAIPDKIFGNRALDGCVPVLVPEAIGKDAASLAAGLGVRYGLTLYKREFGSVFPVDANFGGRQIRVNRDGAGAGDDRGRLRSRIDHSLDYRIGNIGFFETFQSVHTGVQTDGI